MRHTTRLLSASGFPGFWKRSLDELKRWSVSAITLEALEPPRPIMKLWSFDDLESVAACVDMSDSDIGGFSKVKLEHVPATKDEPAYARFSGVISNKVPSDNTEVERTGYAAFRTKDQPPTMFGKALWDVERYRYLALRVKTDGRKYKVNVQTESVIYTDIHQHRLYVRQPHQWETVLIRWRDFVRTNHGIIVEPQSEMLMDKVRTLGIGLTDRVSGPFEMCISSMWATNSSTMEEQDEYEQNVSREGPMGAKLSSDSIEPSSRRQQGKVAA